MHILSFFLTRIYFLFFLFLIPPPWMLTDRWVPWQTYINTQALLIEGEPNPYPINVFLSRLKVSPYPLHVWSQILMKMTDCRLTIILSLYPHFPPHPPSPHPSLPIQNYNIQFPVNKWSPCTAGPGRGERGWRRVITSGHS